ncbi:hypothetical protein [Cryptosporangium sp. NPDC048952]|uniref:hypothetical protein n=1 Tax=Cryptosporangium sp. NPDC048952 TaxID=3363961 RepID=UPI00371505F0
MTTPLPSSDPRVLDLDEIVRLIRTGDVYAVVLNSGGGGAAIYAGEQRPDEHGDERWTACAGPGWFLPEPETGTHWAYGRARIDDFYIGPEDDDDLPISAEQAGITTEAQAAAVIVAQTLTQGVLTLEEARSAGDAV